VNGDGGHWPILLIELVLVFGGVLAFAWWQLRDLARERRAAERRRAAAAAEAAEAAEATKAAGAADPATGEAGREHAEVRRDGGT
jgi:Tfp pilus assembly protein PilV